MTVPLRPGERYDIVGCCDGDPGWLFVLSIAADGPAEAAGLDLGGGASRWTELGMVPVPSSPAARPATGVAIEQQFAAWAGNLDAESGGQRATLLSLRRPSDPWVVTAPTNQAIDAGPLLLSPNHLISPLAGLAYDLVEPRWLHLPARPGQDSGAPLAASWWDRGRLWVLDANGQDGSSRLWSFQPRALKGAQQLPSGTRPPTAVEPCVLFGETGIWRLRGDPRDDRLVWLQRGARREYLDWPDGWHVRFEPAVVITDSAGKVRHREGGRCPAVTGTGG